VDKLLSMNELRTRCAQLVIDWRTSSGDERQEAQSFVRDLLNAFGISDTRAAFYEKRVQRTSTANQGYIDALIPGLVLIEMKSAGKNLGLAEIQALDYIQHLEEAETPRYILTSDFRRLRVLDLHAPKVKDTIEFALEDLPKNVEALGFLAGYQTRAFGNHEQEAASIKAAKIMAQLYEALDGSGYGDHEASVFLVRTLFTLYADDAGVWSRDQFTEFIKTRTSVDGSDLGPQLTMLFQVMNQPLGKRVTNLDEALARFPYVNGGVFSEALPIPAFDKKMRDQLLRASEFNWSKISPAIFGSLFQAVKSAESRRELGEHYTTEKNILKTIEPLFLDELRLKFDQVSNDISGLKKLRKELGLVRILDPACGCGNFLVVSYRELRALELQILLRLQELGDTTSLPTLYFERTDLAVRLEHVFGIEIEEWPARIAQTALVLADHQANLAMELALGKSPGVLPLETVSGIHIGNALRTEWSTVVAPSSQVFVVGNPPFVGQKEKSAEQKADLKAVWGADYDGYLDLVTGWIKKAADYFQQTPGGQFAFVSTNSITQGQPVSALFSPLFDQGWRIKFAHKTFSWASEAPGSAQVHCIVIGFTNAKVSEPHLYIYASPTSDPVQAKAQNINAYLIDGANVLVGKRMRPLNPQLGQVNSGSTAFDWGHLTLEESPIENILSAARDDPIASKYLRRYVGGEELINSVERWCFWLNDALPDEIRASRVLRTQVEAVQNLRSASTRLGTLKAAQTPHLFGEDRQPPTDYLAIPQTFSEHRFFATADRLPADVIANKKLFTVADPDGFAFAVVSSSMFITWQKAIGGRLKSDPSFSNTLVWNNLPLPSVPEELRQKVIEAGQAVLSAREKFPDRSLAAMYNPLAMDPDLLKAHARLDRVVDKAFGATASLQSNEERQEVLFERYLELTAYG
jgi:hypothetical protein